jgi:hypothetical protein
MFCYIDTLSGVMVFCFSCSHFSAGLLQKNSSCHGIIYDGIMFKGKIRCSIKSNVLLYWHFVWKCFPNGVMVFCFSCSHFTAGLLQKKSSRHRIIYDGITIIGKIGCWIKSNVLLYWHFVWKCFPNGVMVFCFSCSHFSAGLLQKNPLAMGSSTMELPL